MLEGDTNMGGPPKDYPPDRHSGYYMVRDCEASIFVYDVTNRASFESLGRYHQNFCEERCLERPPWRLSPSSPLSKNPPRPPFRGLFFVIANKIDRDRSDWAVSINEGEDFSARMEAIFLQMSAETGEGAQEEVLNDMASHILLRKIQNIIEDDGQEKAERTVAGPYDNALQGPSRSNFWKQDATRTVMPRWRDTLFPRRKIRSENTGP